MDRTNDARLSSISWASWRNHPSKLDGLEIASERVLWWAELLPLLLLLFWAKIWPNNLVVGRSNRHQLSFEVDNSCDHDSEVVVPIFRSAYFCSLRIIPNFLLDLRLKAPSYFLYDYAFAILIRLSINYVDKYLLESLSFKARFLAVWIILWLLKLKFPIRILDFVFKRKHRVHLMLLLFPFGRLLNWGRGILYLFKLY